MNSASHGQRPDVLWITNYPMEYRVPVWQALGRAVRLNVLCLDDYEGRLVALQTDRALDVELCRAPGISIRNHRIYLPTVGFLRRILRSRPSCLYIDGWESPAYLVALLYGKIVGSTIALGYRSTVESQRHHRGPIALVRRGILRLADHVIVSGASSSRGAVASGVDPGRIVVAHNSVDVSGIARRVGEIRRTRPAAALQTLYVGQLIARKNVATLIDAWKVDAGVGEELHIVGDGPLASEIREKINRDGLVERVRMHGRLTGDDLDKRFADASIFCLPSTEEVWGLVVNEALAAGLQVVVSDRAGVAEEVAEMEGVVVCPPDTASLAGALNAIRARGAHKIEAPMILGFTPEATAKKIAESVVSRRPDS